MIPEAIIPLLILGGGFIAYALGYVSGRAERQTPRGAQGDKA